MNSCPKCGILVKSAMRSRASRRRPIRASTVAIGYSNKTFDRLCDQADREPDAKKRLALYLQAQKIALQDAPWVPIYYQRDAELIRPSVKDIRNCLLGHLPHTTTRIER